MHLSRQSTGSQRARANGNHAQQHDMALACTPQLSYCTCTYRSPGFSLANTNSARRIWRRCSAAAPEGPAVRGGLVSRAGGQLPSMTSQAWAGHAGAFSPTS